MIVSVIISLTLLYALPVAVSVSVPVTEKLLKTAQDVAMYIESTSTFTVAMKPLHLISIDHELKLSDGDRYKFHIEMVKSRCARKSDTLKNYWVLQECDIDRTQTVMLWKPTVSIYDDPNRAWVLHANQWEHTVSAADYKFVPDSFNSPPPLVEWSCSLPTNMRAVRIVARECFSAWEYRQNVMNHYKVVEFVSAKFRNIDDIEQWKFEFLIVPVTCQRTNNQPLDYSYLRRCVTDWPDKMGMKLEFLAASDAQDKEPIQYSQDFSMSPFRKDQANKYWDACWNGCNGTEAG